MLTKPPYRVKHPWMSIELSKILEIHNSYSKEGQILSHCFGDGFLYQTNPVFRNVRDYALKSRIKFTDRDFCFYKTMPLAALRPILKTNKIPYFDNVSVLKDLNKSLAKGFKYKDLVPLRVSTVFHETCHCIGSKSASNLDLSKAKLKINQKTVLRLILSEALANTAESIGNAFSLTPEARIFYAANSNIFFHDIEMARDIRNAIGNFGSKTVFRLVFISYVFSNLLYENASEETFLDAMRAVLDNDSSLSNPKNRNDLKTVFDRAFLLALGFRVKTADCFFKLSGIYDDLEKLLDIDFLEILKKSDCIQTFIAKSESLFEVKAPKQYLNPTLPLET